MGDEHDTLGGFGSRDDLLSGRQPMQNFGCQISGLSQLLDALLHISSFIVVCEAFLRITPHFGLWLKTFNVKPKMIEGRHAECGGALISKIVDAPWPEGSFPEVSRLWQRDWFYITAPRSAKWVAAPTFRSGPHHN